MAREGGTMKAAGLPPRWAEFILERLLASEDRQTVTGDLVEEYAGVILPRMGRLRADLWFLRQVISFVPQCAIERGNASKSLLLLSLLTLVCCSWLAYMESLMRHPGYFIRIAVDVSIALIALSTILVRLLHVGIRAERCLWPAAIAVTGIAVRGFAHNARSDHFEGFVFVISLVLTAQGLFMLLSLGRAANNPHRPNRGGGDSR